MNKPTSHLRAIGYAFMGFAFWVLSDTCIKLAGETAIPPYEIVSFLGFSGAVTILVKSGIQRQFANLRPKHPLVLFKRGLLLVALSFCNIIALKHLPLTIFYVMAFLSPLIIPVMAYFVLQEKLTRAKTAAIIMGFIGVIIAIFPNTAKTAAQHMQSDWIGYSAMVLAALAFSTNAIWLRRMTQSETMDSIVFSTALVEMVACFIPVLIHPVAIDLRLGITLFAAGAFSLIGNLYNCAALKYTTAANVAQFHYTQIITGALIGYFIWDEVPTSYLLAGSALIIGSGLYIANHARKRENLAAINVEGKPTV